MDELRSAVRDLCSRFGEDYWQKADEERAYPEAFVRALTDAGYLACLIPEEYGGPGLGIREACVILEEINRSGANSAACHAQMYTMGTILRHGSESQNVSYVFALHRLGVPLITRRDRRPHICRCSPGSRVPQPRAGTSQELDSLSETD